MRLTDQQLNRVWLYVFGKTMRERAAIHGSGSEPERRFAVAVADADEACASEKAASAWYNDATPWLHELMRKEP